MPMRKLTWIIDRLPGVRPRLASTGIKNGTIPGVMDDVHFIHGEHGPAMLVGPDAARLVLEAYRRGGLPMHAGANPVASPPAAAYLDDEDRLRAEAAKHRLARAGSDPFADWRSMEEIFRRAGHPIPAALDVRDIRGERRNDGGRDPQPEAIEFAWTGAEGSPVIMKRRGGPQTT